MKHWKLSPETLAHREMLRKKSGVGRQVSKKMRAWWESLTTEQRSKQSDKVSVGTEKGMNTPEVRAKLRARPYRKPWNYGLSKETDVRVAQGGRALAQFLTENPRVSPLKGRRNPKSKATARRQGKTFRERYAAGLIRLDPRPYSRVVHVKKTGELVYLKSGYEKIFAECLDGFGAEWFYEPKRFRLRNGRSYTPDFLVFIPSKFLSVFGVPWQFVEVKGWWRLGAKRKFKMFQKEYPEIPICIVAQKEIDELRLLSQFFSKQKLTPAGSDKLVRLTTRLKAEASILGYEQGYTPGGAKDK